MSSSPVPLVGRSTELTELRAAVERARSGVASAVVMGGDAGVGKTRLLTELLGTARAEGVLPLVGHCLDLGDMPPPYLPFTEAFTRRAVEDPAEMGRLVGLFPALARLLPAHLGLAGPPGAAGDDRVERGDLFDAVLGALGAMGAEQPVLLVVEDIHWADQATRDLLGYLVARLNVERVAVVTTYRSDDLHRRHPLRRTLAEWTRLPGLHRVHLDPLSADDVRRLLGSENVHGLSAGDLDDIVDRAEGNAFFAEELLSAANQFEGADQLPWQLADLLLVRLDRLSDDARQVVRVAAVGGRRVPYDMVESAIELTGPRLEEALREALDSNILQLTPSGRGYVFRHALLGEAIYDDLLPSERVRIHARYARRLAEEPGRSPSELARHSYASHDYPTAFEASVAAGRAAMSLAAPQEALGHFENALELIEQLPQTDPGRVDLTLLAADAAEAAGRYLRGGDLARGALAELPPEASDLDRARLLTAQVRLATSGEVDEEALSVATRALQLAPHEPPTAFLAQLMALQARVASALGHDVDAQRTAEQALQTATLAGSATAAADAAATLAALERRTGSPDDAARQLEAAIAQAHSARDVGTELRTWFSLGSLLHEQCELDRALEVFTAGRRRAIETGRPWDIFGLHNRAMIATVRWMQGDWNTALRILDTTADERPTGLAAAVLRATALAVRAGRGEHGVVAERAQLEPFWLREGRVALYYAFGALTALEQQGDSAAAIAVVEEVSATLGQLWLNEWFLGRIQLSAQALAVVAADAATAPQSRHVRLAEQGAELLATGLRSAERGLPHGRELGREGRAWIARLRAEEARVRWLTGVDAPAADELVALWHHALDEFDFGHVAASTVVRTRLVEALQAAGDTAEAGRVAAVARADADRMGARPLLAQLDAAVGARRGSPDRNGSAPRGLGALTDRERGVLAELLEGRSNRQIAAKLFISEKTASVHVSNIMAKLGVRSRAEAAALARRAGAGQG
ncbi:AAA family ATPase [uncultured Jatrophihabitans sp.]|uniref:helix-turn-helix transcriptional regulator n=1 Tax=uncultured Jatrophihabitans sp. TaxID=1610747 RepID=UPI0035CC1280